MIDDELKSQLQRIDAEFRRLGLLSGPLGPPQTVRSAFGLSEMPFEDWLMKVFLPRAYEASASGAWPSSSQVGTMALRNFDGQEAYAPLITLLCDFDQMIVRRSFANQV